MTTLSQLICNPHAVLKAPFQPAKMVTGKYAYFHYVCDDIDDVGWGCGYRTLQTLCSWTVFNYKDGETVVPSIPDIQKALVEMGDKSKQFESSREWIGSFEVCLCMDYFYEIPCKIQHIRANENLYESLKTLQDHFSSFGSPVMMGGDCDAASKCILGICGDSEINCHLLVLDPHCSKAQPTIDDLVEDKWISWRSIDTFMKSSFYNLCLPQRGIAK